MSTGGMICNCNDALLEQLGVKSEEDRLNFVNFYCRRCYKFVHLHAITPMIADDQPEYCTPCSYFPSQGKGGLT